MTQLNVLVVGAAYGGLVAGKVALAGHKVTLLGRAEEVRAIAAHGLALAFDAGPRTPALDICLPIGAVNPVTPEGLHVAGFDLAFLAVSEPQLGSADMRDVLAELGKAAVPTVSVMNMPPVPCLAEMVDLAGEDISRIYTDPGVWSDFKAGMLTHSSPDPQVVRPDAERPNVLRVTLPTNFKIRTFAGGKAGGTLTQLANDINATRAPSGDTMPVHFRLHRSKYLPMAKWPMLIAGNYRSVLADGSRSIADAIWADLAESRAIYDFVGDLCRGLGCPDDILVPFERYAAAARSLSLAASGARALDAGAKRIERVDRLALALARRAGKDNDRLATICKIVDGRLAQNGAPS